MKPGRELDALVAEKVMGWKRMSYIESGQPKAASPERLTGYWHSIDSKAHGRAIDSFIVESSEDVAWSPSTDIAAAFQVVEKLTEGFGGFGPEFDLSKSELNTDQMYWRANFWDRHSVTKWKGNDQVAYAPTAPHAICLASLKAVGHE